MLRRYISFVVILLLVALSVVSLYAVVGTYYGTLKSRSAPVQVHTINTWDTVGLFHAGTFSLKNTLGAGPADEIIKLGTSQMLPVVGDWDGDGVDTVGVYDPATSRFMLQNINETGAPIAYNFVFGPHGGVPVSGDWTGSGHDSVGVYYSGVFYLRNTLSAGPADERIVFGRRGDVPVTGDWIGKGHDGVGVYLPTTGTFYLTNMLCKCSPTATYSGSFGPHDSLPFAGDWTHSGHSGLGVLSPATGKVYLWNDATVAGPANFTYGLDAGGDVPVAGHWSATSS